VAAAVRRSAAFQVERAQGVQTMSVRSAALPQARRAPTPWFAQSSTLYIVVRQPVWPAGITVSPSLLPEAQVRPPSNERSIHTSSPVLPLPTEAQAMASASSKCSRNVREKSVAVTGVRSWPLRAGSRASQYLLHTAAAAAAAEAGGAAWSRKPDIVVRAVSRSAAKKDRLARMRKLPRLAEHCVGGAGAGSWKG
jgi:hypothetical protein